MKNIPDLPEIQFNKNKGIEEMKRTYIEPKDDSVFVRYPSVSDHEEV
jgi:hypothetical protein